MTFNIRGLQQYVLFGVINGLYNFHIHSMVCILRILAKQFLELLPDIDKYGFWIIKIILTDWFPYRCVGDT